jgi:hypothetical protein
MMYITSKYSKYYYVIIQSTCEAPRRRRLVDYCPSSLSIESNESMLEEERGKFV